VTAQPRGTRKHHKRFPPERGKVKVHDEADKHHGAKKRDKQILLVKKKSAEPEIHIYRFNISKKKVNPRPAT
jgi:hypothetical protein